MSTQSEVMKPALSARRALIEERADRLVAMQKDDGHLVEGDGAAVDAVATEPNAQQTDATVRDVARFAAAQPEAVTVDAFVGRGATRFMLTYTSEQPNPAYGQLVVRTDRLDDIPALAERIVAYARETHPDIEARSERIVFGPPAGAQLEARFQGPDAAVLRRLGEEAVWRICASTGATALWL